MTKVLPVLKPGEAPSFGYRLKRRRLELGYTLEKVARLIGVSRVSIYKWENDEVVPRPAARAAINKALEIPPPDWAVKEPLNKSFANRPRL